MPGYVVVPWNIRAVDMSSGGPVNKKLWPTNLTTTNFTMPAAPGGSTSSPIHNSASAINSSPPGSIEIRVLVDQSMLEVFVARGRGVITQSLLSRGGQGGGKGVYFLGGERGPATIVRATAWDMGWGPCSAP